MENDFRKRLEEAIADSGLSISSVAKHMDVTEEAVYKWLRKGGNKPRRDRVIKLGRLLGVSREWLEYGEEESKPIHMRALGVLQGMENIELELNDKETTLLNMLRQLPEDEWGAVYRDVQERFIYQKIKPSD